MNREETLATIRSAPRNIGRVVLVVRRPAVGEREVVTEAILDPRVGMIGDSWSTRPSRHTPDRSPCRDMQVTLMCSRVAAAVAGPIARWPLAGDQLYVDLDLSAAALPTGTRLRVGTAVVEVTEIPHLGCAKFAARFGKDALRFVNAKVHRPLRLRGINTRVVMGGVVRPGDVVQVVATTATA